MLEKLTDTFEWLNRDIALITAGRIFRSLSAGFVGILFPVYVAKLGFDAVHLSYLVCTAAASGGVLAAVVGFCSDRFGRRNLLICMALMQAVGCIAFAISGRFEALLVGAAMGAMGGGGPMGGGGAFGAYFPAEQALVAEHSADISRTAVFGALSFVGVAASAVGALIAGVPALMRNHFDVTLLSGYRGLFWSATGLALATVLITIPIRERRSSGTDSESHPHADAIRIKGGRRTLGLSHVAWGIVGRFWAVGVVNGFAFGMLGPFLILWFYTRFGAGPSRLASVFFVVNLVAMIPYLSVSRVTRRAGTVNTIGVSRFLSSVVLGLMVLMPTYFAAALLFVLRAGLNALSIPARQSYMMGLTDPAERATVSGLTTLAPQTASLVSPYLAGVLMDSAWTSMPIEIAAILQALSAGLFYVFFRGIQPPEEEAAGVAQALALDTVPITDSEGYPEPATQRYPGS
jgi:MFS family permease